MDRLAITFAGLLFLGACGANNQQTPEPQETERVNALVEKLGVQRSYNSQTSVMNAEPDGRVLMSWMDRRQATLAGTLPLSKLPASTNPGTIQATLEWERKAQRAESGNSNALANYMLDYEGRRGCGAGSRDEAEWYARERNAHAKGLRPTLIDWEKENARFQARCDIVSKEQSIRADAEKRSGKDAAAELLRGQLACKAPWEEAERIYNDTLTVETGSAATAASVQMRACLGELERRSSSAVAATES